MRKGGHWSCTPTLSKLGRKYHHDGMYARKLPSPVYVLSSLWKCLPFAGGRDKATDVGVGVRLCVILEQLFTVYSTVHSGYLFIVLAAIKVKIQR